MTRSGTRRQGLRHQARNLPGTDRAAALHRRALAAHAAGDFATAIDRLQHAITIEPRIAAWHTQLGVVLRAAGRLVEAVAAHRQAVALDARLPAAHNNLGNALRAAREWDAAEAALREACRLAPDYADAHENLARLFCDRNLLAEAAASYRRALELRPNSPMALGELGGVLARCGDFAGAERCLRQLCEARPADAEAAMSLGAVLEALGRFEEADAAYERVVALDPDRASAHFAHGRRLQQRGETVAAAQAFRQALARDRHIANAYLSLATMEGERLSAEERRAIEELLASPELPAEDRSSLYYALARTAEREKEWDAAFRWAQRANEIDHARTAFDEFKNFDFVRRTIANFQPERWVALPPGSPSERPIFIVGMPRSGTTLVEQIIASHPQAAAGGELVEIPDLAERLAGSIGSQRAYPECVFDLDEASVRSFAASYLERLDRVSGSAIRVTDKLPFNFRHLGLITALFPQARIIHCRRDPRDVAVSCFFIKFHRPISFACDLFELGAYLRHYEELMAHWRLALPRRMIEVRYEELVADTEREVRRIIDFCGLPWDNCVLSFHETDRAVRTASAEQVRRPIYAGSIGRWQHYARYLVPLYAELEGRPSLRAHPRRVAAAAPEQR